MSASNKRYRDLVKSLTDFSDEKNAHISLFERQHLALQSVSKIVSLKSVDTNFNQVFIHKHSPRSEGPVGKVWEQDYNLNQKSFGDTHGQQVIHSPFQEPQSSNDNKFPVVMNDHSEDYMNTSEILLGSDSEFTEMEEWLSNYRLSRPAIVSPAVKDTEEQCRMEACINNAELHSSIRNESTNLTNEKLLPVSSINSEAEQKWPQRGIAYLRTSTHNIPTTPQMLPVFDDISSPDSFFYRPK